MLVVAEDDETWMVEPLARLVERSFRCTVRPAGTIRPEDAHWITGMSVTFVRSRSSLLLRALDAVDAGGSLVVNRPCAVRRSRHRATALAMAAACGVPTARDYEGPLASIPFPHAVVKRRLDDGRSKPVRYERGCAAGREDRIVYAQELIDSPFEHKIYVVGDELFAFEQRPTLDHPDKLATRRRVPVDATLGARARRVADAIGLEVAGVDFLFDGGEPKVTDVNSNQGLHTFSEGYGALEAYLLSRVRGAGASRTSDRGAGYHEID
jgi:glutathione synthase/RimK-type ligase-like ATP-grasp enzyme